MPTRQNRLDDFILTIVKENPHITRKEIIAKARLAHLSESDRTITQHLTQAVRSGTIRRVASQGNRNVGYVDLLWFAEAEAQRFEERRIHSDDLKKIIQAWIDEFPYVSHSERGPETILSRSLIVGTHYQGSILPVEQNTLFADLKNHIGEDLIEKWERMRSLACKIDKARLQGEDNRVRNELERFEVESAKILRTLRRSLLVPVLIGICDFLSRPQLGKTNVSNNH